LIVVGVTQLAPLTPQGAKQVPFVVAQHLYDKDLIPKNYDSSGMKPFLLLVPKAPEATESGSRSNDK
jgi:hypothetical protein